MMLSAVASLHVGSVEACSSSEIKILLDADAPQDMALNTGRPQGFPRLNGYVLIPNEGGTVVAVIARMTMEPAPFPGGRDREAVPILVSRRRLFASPVGTLELRRDLETATDRYRLHRGVASYPAVGDAVILPTNEQLRAVVEASGADRRVTIGTAPLALDAPVSIDPDKLFGRHVGVFGNTGSGKSCTVSGLIRWSVEAAAQEHEAVAARFIILDPNGEYRSCFKDLADAVDVSVFSVEPADDERCLQVPAWMWNGQEWAGALRASPGAQQPVLMQTIRQLRAAGVAGAGSVPPDERLLLATTLRAFEDYLQGCRAQGVAALGRFPQNKHIFQNLEALEDQLLASLRSLRADEDALNQAIKNIIAAASGARTRRTSAQGYLEPFHDGDIAPVVSAIAAMRALLPDAAIIAGPSEDMPARFDPHAIPGMLSLLAGLQPGNLQQHMAGLDLRVRTLLADSRILPMIVPEDGGAPLAEWLKSILGSGETGRGQITVLDLSLVPSDVLTTLISVVARLVFETAQRYRRATGNTLPTVLLLEEAHNFVKREGPDTDGSDPAIRCRQIFEKIAKEGRKFGVGLILSSQRPAELSPTIVAQCNSFVLHRIVNDRDQELVSRLAPDTSATLLKELPSLPTQKAILMGIAAEIPLVFDVRALQEAQRPSSANPDLWSVWTHERELDLDLNRLAAGWSE